MDFKCLGKFLWKKERDVEEPLTRLMCMPKGLPGRAPADQGRGGPRLRRGTREWPRLGVGARRGNTRAGALGAGGGARP